MLGSISVYHLQKVVFVLSIHCRPNRMRRTAAVCTTYFSFGVHAWASTNYDSIWELCFSHIVRYTTIARSSPSKAVSVTQPQHLLVFRPHGRRYKQNQFAHFREIFNAVCGFVTLSCFSPLHNQHFEAGDLGLACNSICIFNLHPFICPELPAGCFYLIRTFAVSN